MEDEPDTDVENGSVPPTLSNLLTLADHEGDEDEETNNEGISDGDHDEGDSISTRSEEKNPSHPIDNKFFYISQSNTVIPKEGLYRLHHPKPTAISYCRRRIRHRKHPYTTRSIQRS